MDGGTHVQAGPSAVLKPRNLSSSSSQPSSVAGATTVVSRTSGGGSSTSAAEGSENRHVEHHEPPRVRVKPDVLPTTTTTTAIASVNVGGGGAGGVTTESIRGGQLRICTVTWNMNKRRFPRNLKPMLAPLFGEGDGDVVAGGDGNVIIGGGTAGAEGMNVPCDVFVVGVQEAPAMDGFVDTMLGALGGRDVFAHLEGVSLEPGGWIQMEVFVRRELLPMVTDVKRDAVSCGFGNVVGNKGGVGVSFNYAGARLCFLNAHLAAHKEKVKQRNADYHRIVKTMFAPKEIKGGGSSAAPKKVKGNAVAPADAPAADASSESKSGTACANAAASTSSDSAGGADPRTPLDPDRPTPETPSMFGGLIKRQGWSAAEGFDLCVFMGDLNYRVEGNRQAVDVLMERGMMEVMRANDQLSIERTAGRAFDGWSEGELAFPPTYKLDRGSVDAYDTSAKKRVPSWTDRVMWRTKPLSRGGKVLCESGADVYTSARGVRTSDHLPVVARIEATLADASRPIIGGGGTAARHHHHHRPGGDSSSSASLVSRITLCSVM